MKKSAILKKKINNYLFDHYILSSILSHGNTLLHSLLGAAIFAFGFCCFATPAPDGNFTLVTGGLSGISQNIALLIEIATGKPIGNNTIQSISYFALNLPILVFAFFAIGKRFSIYTLVNVLTTSGLIMLFSMDGGIGQTVAKNSLISGSVLSRVLFAGICTGVSSAVAFKGDTSCGGVDIFTYYFALRKSTSVGKYGVLVNGVVVSLYSILLTIKNPVGWDNALVSLLYSICYLLSVSLVVDAINLRNKKVQLQVITTNKDLGSILVANFPHGATSVNSQGVYSQQEMHIFYMIISSSEMKSAIQLTRKVDPHAFISVTSLVQVYGRFFIKPIE